MILTFRASHGNWCGRGDHPTSITLYWILQPKSVVLGRFAKSAPSRPTATSSDAFFSGECYSGKHLTSCGAAAAANDEATAANRRGEIASCHGDRLTISEGICG